jgi:hypothetical protein
MILVIPLPVDATCMYDPNVLHTEMRAVTPGATRRLFRKAVVEPVTPQ